jgi:uncharacterized protein YrzB (UPF0473 family)
MRLYEYAVFKDEKLDKDGEVVDKAVVLVKPTTVLAKDERQVGILAAKSISDKDMDDLDRIQVVVRPF